MMPVYVTYFAGSGSGRGETLKNALCFVAGFTLIFSLMGSFAGAIGMLLRDHRTIINIASGTVVILLGLNFLGILRFNIVSPFSKITEPGEERKIGPAASAVFGIVFAIAWTPCIGVFLGSALMIAATSDSALQGFSMLVCYSAGLGIPFVMGAVLIDMFKSAFAIIKRNYKVVNAVAGWCLVILGAFMMTGYFGRFVQ